MVEATREYYLAQVTALKLELKKVQMELVLGLNSLEEKVRELELEKAALMEKKYPLGKDWA